MSIQNLLEQFMGSAQPSRHSADSTNGNLVSTLSRLTGNIPGGLMGGAAAGGIMALLVSNKKARKFAGTAAAYGGAAIIGGLAYKAYKNWKHNGSTSAEVHAQQQPFTGQPEVYPSEVATVDIDLLLIKSMIAAAKADGHIDTSEQQRIFKAVEQMDLSPEMKGMVFDLLKHPISIKQLTQGVNDMTLKSEIYLASCLVINPDHPSEQQHLDQLANALGLPEGLTDQIKLQAEVAVKEAA